ncbi:hypothetical protein KAZ66_01830 [Candidatus Woesebacteria bacterium]|nr:hypothetical protein [Candidatus Woesebacteria bacterium]
MRSAVIDSIYQQMKENSQVYFLTGDLGFSVVEKIEAAFPDRFINMGIAEQNMIGVAAGLALTGKKVYVYSIIPFVTMRCFEQIRNDLCYHNLDVTLVGAGAGLSYGILSATHFALEDVAIFRPLPHMSIFSPSDATTAELGMKYLSGHHGPVYVRMGKKIEPTIYEKAYPFVFGKAQLYSEGNDILIVTSGPIMSEAVSAAKLLEAQNITSTILDIHTIKPLDADAIQKHVQGKKLIVTVEEHSVTGGLGSAVLESLSTFSHPPLLRIGTQDEFIKVTGTQEYLRGVVGLTASDIAEKVRKMLHSL